MSLRCHLVSSGSVFRQLGRFSVEGFQGYTNTVNVVRDPFLSEAKMFRSRLSSSESRQLVPTFNLYKNRFSDNYFVT